MKTQMQKLLLVALMLAPAVVGRAQFSIAISNSAVTITKFAGGFGDLRIPATFYNLPVTRIGAEAFYQCSGLTGITLPDRVTSIGEGAFSHCNSLARLSIPNGVTNIGGGAFGNCTSLPRLTIPSGVTFIGNSMFAGCTHLFNVTLPNSITNIGDGAFANCPSLASLTLPESLTGIGDWTFEFCTGLTNITIPNSVTHIGDGAFLNCYSLMSLPLADSVTFISDGAFENCSSLTSVTIPGSVTFIGDGAFNNCDSLTRVNFGGNAPRTGLFPFQPYSATAYYLPGTAGWTATFAGLPTAPWIVALDRPSLAILRSGGYVVLSWPTNAAGFTLQFTTNLIPPAVWRPVLPAPTPVNGQNTVTNSTPGPQRFYRLAQ